jgi:Ni/Co efflux regulator RcnB
MTFSRLLVALLAASLMLALAAVPASAAEPKAKQSQSARKLNSDLRKVRQRTTTAERRIRSINRTLAQLRALSGSNKGQLDFLLGAAPALVSGLQQTGAGLVALRDGLTRAGAGLTALQTAVETRIAPGLTRLGDAYGAVEYGRAGVFATNGTVAAGGTLTSADIPDDGNTIQSTEDAIIVATGGPMAVDLRAAIRSAEDDGDAADETAGQAGGFVFVKNADTGARVACGGAPNPPGILGTVAGDPIVTPSGTVTNLSLKNIPGGVGRTDTAAPTSTSTSLLPAPCQFAAGPGDVFEVKYSVNFADIPTTASPGPKD